MLKAHFEPQVAVNLKKHEEPQFWIEALAFSTSCEWVVSADTTQGIHHEEFGPLKAPKMSPPPPAPKHDLLWDFDDGKNYIELRKLSAPSAQEKGVFRLYFDKTPKKIKKRGATKKFLKLS